MSSNKGCIHSPCAVMAECGNVHQFSLPPPSLVSSILNNAKFIAESIHKLTLTFLLSLLLIWIYGDYYYCVRQRGRSRRRKMTRNLRALEKALRKWQISKSHWNWYGIYSYCWWLGKIFLCLAKDYTTSQWQSAYHHYWKKNPVQLFKRRIHCERQNQ